MGFAKGLYPTRVIAEKWWETPPVENVLSLNKDRRDTIIIVGDATNVVKDLENFLKLCPVPFDTMCMNYSYMVVPWKIQHFVAGDSHMEDMQKCAAQIPDTCMKHCWNPQSLGFDIRWLKNGRSGWNGTTANLGIKIALALGYTRIVLVGVPMDSSGNWYAPLLKSDDIKQGKDHTNHLWKWNEIASRPISRLLRSMSGNTADLLGKPTEEWILEAVKLQEVENNGEENKKSN